MVAFRVGALEEARFRLIRSPSLLGPKISHLVAAFIAGDLDLGIGFDVFHHFNDLAALDHFFQFCRSVAGIRNLRITTAAVEDAFSSPIFWA